MIVHDKDESEYTQLEAKSYELTSTINAKKMQGDNAYDLKRELLNVRHKMIDILDDRRSLKTMKTARQLIAEVRAKPIMPRYETGIPSLDYELKGGFKPGFIQLSGISGGGKTTLALKILANVAKGNEAVFFNFEMYEDTIADRLDDLLEGNQLDNLLVTSENRELDEVINTIRLKAKSGVKFFMIDSMMKLQTKTHNIIESQIEISGALSQVVQEEGVIVILINQQSEDALKNNRLSLKGSNSQTYDADMIFYIVIKDDKRVLICSKNRQDERTFDLELSLNDVKNTSYDVLHQNIKETEVAYSMPTVI